MQDHLTLASRQTPYSNRVVERGARQMIVRHQNNIKHIAVVSTQPSPQLSRVHIPNFDGLVVRARRQSVLADDSHAPDPIRVGVYADAHVPCCQVPELDSFVL